MISRKVIHLPGIALALMVPFLLLSPGGCAVNPATGERQLVLISEQQEISMGRQYDQQVQAQLGLYNDDTWQQYIQQVGGALAARTERPELSWQFRVIDDPTVNAFALPGGYIYVTRGILAGFNSEAELASVLGHEIGHVTARHSVEQISRAQLTQLGLVAGAILSEDFRRYAGLAQMGLQVLFLKFSRDDERQADDLGLRYMARGGYDPSAMPNVFDLLERQSALGGGQRLPEWQSTHPSPANRSQRIREQLAALPAGRNRVNREGYLRRLDGLTYGENPDEGYTIDNVFYHPGMRFRMDFPAGWKVINQRQAVGGINATEDAMVVLTLADAATPDEALRAFFAEEGIERGARYRENYYHFRTTPQRDPSSGTQQFIQGIVGFVTHQDRVFSLLTYALPERWNQVRYEAAGSITSLRPLTESRYLDVSPDRLEVITLDRAMTLADFQGRYPSAVTMEQLAVLNGITPDARLEAGRLVKRIVPGRRPGR
ncbi:MAG: M48 family metalloprotease [Acidobacteria bacterium]|nr:M48 family metalloprotease [Acidobacteriota bacterium]